ncbi:HAMP domain-containing histidine kinase [Nocardioides sp. Y6]|uniref:Sensor-like histidine kinase SenX3 n=1 Tax=Nocardioides malaquae TaxID=2773426 RepID=A0ABR9RQ23_9ACTN|nr:HAMP domain-containing sensor histidine kinase [Nocardioides malaquae]MBE7323312.1 HAMP domain-containing histidine kinase [Nocardioides malaquae]
MSEHTSGPVQQAPQDDLLRGLGVAGGAVPDGVQGQCDLARAVTGADVVLLTLVGHEDPWVRSGAADLGGVPTTVDLRTSDGQAFGTLTAYAPAAVETAPLEAVAAAVTSMVELEAARSRLFDLEEVVARSEDELSRASGQIVHDLNNPLAAISMCLEIARDEVPEGELLANLLDRAAGSAAKLKTLVVSLSDYGQPAEPGACDLSVEVPALLADYEPLLDETVRVAGDLPVVALAANEARTVLGELWENATKFRRDDVDLEIVVAAEQVGDRWRIAVSDNGRGIDEADVERVLAPTVRLDKRVPGLGLGLAGVARIVTRAGGRVGIDSTPGVGTTVWFEVPAAAPAEHR